MVDSTGGAARPWLDKRVLIGLAVAVALLLWLMWPSGKPPEPCATGSQLGARPGQLVQDYRANGALKIVSSDCTVPTQAATPDEISAARERMEKWVAWDRANQGSAAAAAAGGGAGLWSVFMASVPWWAKPILIVMAIWLVLFGIALLMFLFGFAVVAVFALRHAPLLAVAAPVLVWWKVLVEMPMNLCRQMLDVDASKVEVDRLQRMAWQRFREAVGLARPLPSDPLGDLGSAAFSSSADVQTRDIPGKGRAPLDVGRAGGPALTWHTDKHVLILAGSRAGKGRDIIIPNLLRYQGSMLVIDPKGENFEHTGRYRASVGAVRVLDPWGVTKLPPAERARFNPFALLSADDPESVDTADVLAHGLVLPTGGNDSHWSDSARALWKALLLHVATAPEFEGQRDLITARQILLTGFLPAKKEPKPTVVVVTGSDGQAAAIPADSGPPAAPEAPPPASSTLERMIDNDAFDFVIADFAMSLLNTPEKERGSIISNAQRQTDFLDTPALRASLVSNGEGHLIDFAEWRGERPMSCYLSIPADKLEGSGLRWVRMVVGAALNEMLREQKPPALPVQFILDELASLRRLEQVERAIGLAAGYGVQVWAIWQDLAQMRDLYQSRWASFVGNAGARYVFGVGDFETAKYFSDFMGQATRMVTSEQTDAVGVRLSGVSRNVQTRALMTPDEIMVMDRREMLVLLDGMRPLKATRTAWFEDDALKSRAS